MSDLDNDNEPCSLGDIEMAPVLPMFPDMSRPCVDVWMEMFEKGILSCTHFKDHWRVWVPKIYSPEPNVSCLEWCYDKNKAQKLLFDTLEQFICNGDPQVVLNNMSELENPPSVCGRVFKMGEPTYSCRECGMDSTCVLCVDCFKQSAHRHHKYKMGTSSGGGCCDCGDTEAWRTEPFCDIHVVGTSVAEETKRSMPSDLIERARAVFSAVLKYAYQLLTLEHAPSLPSDLQVKESSAEDPLGFYDTPDTYCTVLFNDETHTFEQVIATLTRLIKCSQKDGIEHVTNIDREGRAVVKCSTFQNCNELKMEIERYTSRNGNRPLKVLVAHAHVVAHQLYAMKLLDWLQKILSLSEGFRVLFSEVALQSNSPDASIIEGILLRDSHLWKSARLHWHRLIISGMLMEYESKKMFGKVFTKNYGTVLKDFMRDDHDHSFSVAAMSVQIFTVPTLAHYLIASEDVLYILFNTFISECTRKLNKQNKLEFERNVANGVFKRAQYILYDLRYLLSAQPKEWTDPLRKGFLQALGQLLKLLSYMQGMDLVTRQVGQHMEYEPEWESAFNLHIKLAHVITLALEWCGSDRVVLIKAYRATLKMLSENPTFDPALAGEVRELADHSASCLQYDIATQPVSIHLPLSRFLAGLHLHLDKYGLGFTSPEFQNTPRPTPEQILETVLRTQVMISQVHAGMWRRNGYSLLNQLYFYHNVKCRSEMLDKDIVLLQVCASLIESNEFLIHLLNKFNLMNWANSQFEVNTLRSPEEDSMRQVINLVEEFLGVLVMIVGERHTPGVGQVTAEDCTKKEIIQQLCIKPLAHSELNKTLPEDVNHETGMEKVIDDIAVFKKPTQGNGKGVYQLKPHLLDEYNVFFYHYTREELSKSEEAQRKRRKAEGQLECCPPPSLPPLTESLVLMANLLQCDVMLHIMQTVLERSINLRARSFSEAQLHKVLYLIGYALLEEEKQIYPFLVFTERAEKWGLEKLIEELCTSPRVEAHKDLLAWTLAKYRQVAAPRQDATSEAATTTVKDSTSSEEAAKEEKEWRVKMAAQKRAKIMAQMLAMQKTFMKENAKLFELNESEMEKTSELSGSSMDLTEGFDATPVALGRNQTAKVTNERSYTCILCQEDQTVTAKGTALVLAAFIQQSTVLCQSRAHADHAPDPLYLPSTLGYSPHVSSCGHVMHSACWQKYFDNVLAKENRRPYRIRQLTSYDVEKHEFLCPMCECLSNTVLPLLPPLGSLQTNLPSPDIGLDSWLLGIEAALKDKDKILDLVSTEPDAMDEADVDAARQSAADRVQLHRSRTVVLDSVATDLGPDGPGFRELFPTPSSDIALSASLTDMIHLFVQATYTKGLGVNPNTFDTRLPLLAWKACAYTVRSLECLLRSLDKPLLGDLSSRQQDCLEALVRIVGVIGSTSRSGSDGITTHAIRLLATVLENPSDGPCVLDWDPLGVLVPLLLSLPSLFLCHTQASVATGNLQDLYGFQVVFLSHIVQILLTADFDESFMEEESNEALGTSLATLMRVCRRSAGLGVEDQISSSAVLNVVKRSSCPFLRSASIFFHFLTGVPASPALMEVGGDSFENLCSYLGLPEQGLEFLDSPSALRLAEKWSAHEGVRKGLAAEALVRPPLPVNKLVALPVDYSELINTVSQFNCPNNAREDSRNPTMCLVCGDMLCSQSYCCQTEVNKTLVGACTYHALECGAGVGIFLRIRECEILLLASPNRGCFVTPPYLDQYGESDQGLRRGNPLRLCEERYEKLQHLWLSHGIHEEIARALESTNNLVTTQWQHL